MFEFVPKISPVDLSTISKTKENIKEWVNLSKSAGKHGTFEKNKKSMVPNTKRKEEQRIFWDLIFCGKTLKRNTNNAILYKRRDKGI